MRVWITKYALTRGVFTANVDEPTPDYPHTIEDRMLSIVQYYHGSNWHRSRPAAIARVEVMRQAKLKSLTKAINDLKRKRIEVPE